MGNRHGKNEEEWADGVCKIVMVGDDTSGKTSLGMREVFHVFGGDYVPMVLDDVVMRDREYGPYHLWEYGEEDREKLTFVGANCFLVCFSVVSPESFENVAKKWIPVIKLHSPNARGVLVGTKTDLRNDPATLKLLEEKGLSPVTSDEGGEAGEKYNMPYLECSAVSGEGVEDVFRAATTRESHFFHLHHHRHHLHGPKRAHKGDDEDEDDD
eukprot:CAMPEP_0201484466 /NCGR_PEP_ID=MMETSP0151_2-20130828/8652_1 /ASSEMBLY_ACC=CAM_ASM_000257 /TAXON_ID=200890 /ORGANISM="Paramoeba atlantica, Strain 621/1 / CCAP 1560/9" /LENGTH=211 /DNA_ID=CAMNT_0047868153 /DNA_START=56 /DNA_END=691 /DNA_ORIENTATION=+